MTKLVTNLTKGKEITDDPSLQGGLTLRKDGIDPSIVPNPNNPYEKKNLGKTRIDDQNTSMCNENVIS